MKNRFALVALLPTALLNKFIRICITYRLIDAGKLGLKPGYALCITIETQQGNEIINGLGEGLSTILEFTPRYSAKKMQELGNKALTRDAVQQAIHSLCAKHGTYQIDTPENKPIDVAVTSIH